MVFLHFGVGYVPLIFLETAGGIASSGGGNTAQRPFSAECERRRGTCEPISCAFPSGFFTIGLSVLVVPRASLMLHRTTTRRRGRVCICRCSTCGKSFRGSIRVLMRNLMRMMCMMAVIPGVDRRTTCDSSVPVLVAVPFLIPVSNSGSLTGPLEGAPCFGI